MKIIYKYTDKLLILFFLSFIILITLSAVDAVSPSSPIIYVNCSHGNDSWDGFSWSTAKLSIKNATGTITNGGTVKIANGVYTGVNNTNITIDKNMTITGQSQRGTVIDAQHLSRIFNITTGNNVIIQNLTFTNGNATIVGVIVNNGNLTINNCLLVNNTEIGIYSDYHAGIIYSNGNLTVNKCIFANNVATYGNGAIYNEDGTLIVNSSIFTNNTAYYGVGAISNLGRLTVIGSTFTNNTSSEFSGGAISNLGRLTVIGSTFTNNYAPCGGAIDNYQGLGAVNSSIFTNNRAFWGGAIYNSGNLNVSGSSFTDNSAVYGGAIYNNGKSTMHFNRFIKNFSSDIYNTFISCDANYNWWGSNVMPSTERLVNATVSKWLVLTIKSSSTSIGNYKTSIITADLCHDNTGVYHNPANGHVLNGIKVIFKTTLGTVNSPLYTVNGIVRSTLKSGSVAGVSKVSAAVDNQTANASVKVIDTISPKVISTNPKNGSTGVSRTSTIAIKFSKKVKASIYWSKIYIKNLKTGKRVSIKKWISGNTLYIKMIYPRYTRSWYQIYIPKSAVKDYAGNKASGYILNFKTRSY
jgi:hypothetical protein